MDNETNTQQDLEIGMEQDYLDTIQTLKQTTVSRDDYLKLKQENRKLLDAVMSGTSVEQAASAPAKPRDEEIKELYSDIFVKGEHSNLKFHEKLYRLCDLIEEETGKNPMVPWGFNGESPATPENISAAKRDREGIEALIENADGDSEYFTSQYHRLAIETTPVRPGRAKARR